MNKKIFIRVLLLPIPIIVSIVGLIGATFAAIFPIATMIGLFCLLYSPIDILLRKLNGHPVDTASIKDSACLAFIYFIYPFGVCRQFIKTGEIKID